jgi:hypothetical protein
MAYEQLKEAVQKGTPLEGAQLRKATDKLHLMLVCGEPGIAELESSEKGIFFHIDVFRKAIGYVKDLRAKVKAGDTGAVFGCDRPSARRGGWGDGMKERLEAWEAHVYTRKGRNAGGKVVCESVREWKEKERQCSSSKALSKFFTGTDSEKLQQEYLVSMLDAMVKEWEKVMEQGLEGSLRESCRTQWMKDILDKCSHHTMSCESVLGCMKAVNKVMQTGSHARKAARTNARVSDTWGVFDRMTPREKETVIDVAAQLTRPEREKERAAREANPASKAIRYGLLNRYDESCRTKRNEAEAQRRFRALNDFMDKAAIEYADAIEFHGCELWGGTETSFEKGDVDKMLIEQRYCTVVAPQYL